MIRLKQAVIVEGIYDKITLENIIDATIIPTNGFGIFKDKEKCDFIKKLATKQGIVVITDSDSAGAMIRAYIKNICSDGKITNVYIPQLHGKERRKTNYSKEELLGVEGMKPDIIINALKNSGLLDDTKESKTKKISKNDLYFAGLSGKPESAALRNSFAKFSGLPQGISSSAFLDALNATMDYHKFSQEVLRWRQETDKK